MAQRLRIGSNLGTQGYFLSRPGDDVSAPTRNLLIDSRYPTMSIHQEGRVKMSSYRSQSNNLSLFYASITFPSLGYKPLFWASTIYATSNVSGIPQNTCYYPSSEAGGSNSIEPYGGDLSDGELSIKEQGIWLANNTTLRAKTWINVSSSVNIQLTYIILKNREET